MTSESTKEKRRACALCEGTEFTSLFVLPRFGIVRCRACGVVERDIVLQPTESAELYGEGYFLGEHKDYFVTFEKEKEVRFISQLKKISEHVPSSGKVLDVGCGIGTFLRAAEGLGYEVSGQDISATSVALARERTGGELYVGPLFDRAYAADSFDMVTLWDSLNHSEVPGSMLEEIRRILKPGGVVVIQMNAQDSLLYMLAELLYRLSGGVVSLGIEATYPVHQSTFFTPAVLASALKGRGFEVCAIRRIPFHTRSCSVIRRSLLHRVAFSMINTVGNIAGRPMNFLIVGRKI